MYCTLSGQLKTTINYMLQQKCGDNGSSRGDSGSGDKFDVGSGNNDCSNDSNGDSNIDGDSSDKTNGELG